MPQILQDQIIFDYNDWFSGLHPQFGTTNRGQMIAGGLSNSTSTDPFRYWGYMSPGYVAENGTNTSVVDALSLAGVIGTTTNAYILAGAKIHEVASSTGNVTNAGSFPKTIAGTAPVGSDMVRYFVGSTEYAFYSYSTSSSWNVGRFDMSSTFNDTYMTATAASPLASPYTTDGAGYPHPEVVGDDDILYIGDRNYLHGFDGQTGANGTFGAAALVLPKGFVITSFAKIQPDKLVIFAYKRGGNSNSYAGEVFAFFWDYASSDPEKKIKISANYVSSAFEYDTTVGCWVTNFSDRNITNTNSLMIYDGVRFKRVATTGDTIPSKNGVEVIGGVIYSNCGGTVYAWGNQVDGYSNGLHKITSGDSTQSGLLKTFFEGTQMISSGTGTTGGIQILNRQKYAAGASFTTTLATPIFKKGFRGKVKGVRVEYGKTTSGGRATQLILYDRSGTPAPDVFSSTATVTSGNLIHEYTNAEAGAWPEFDAIKAQINWLTGSGSSDAANIARIIIYYETINVTKKR